MFPVSLVSASALVEVDGTYCYLAWWADDPQDYVSFTNQVISPSDFNKITVQVDIDLINPIEAKTVFDIDLGFNFSNVGSITVTKFQPMNTSNVALDNLSVSVVNNKISVSELQYKEDVKYIRVQFLIERPTWTVKNVEGNITIAGKTYKYQKNMTWGEWCDSSYDTIGLYVDNGKVYGANVKLVYDGVTVNANDYIIQNGVYSFVPLDSTTTTTNFYVNDTKYSCDTGMTWYEFITSDYNDGSFTTLYDEDHEYDLVLYNEVWVGTGYEEYVTAGEEIIHDFKYYTGDIWNSINYALVNYYFDFSLTSVSVQVEDEQGVFNGIFAWIKEGVNNIKELPQRIGETVGNKLNELGDFLIEKIKGLFVPTEAELLEILDKFQALLSDRFGIAYQAEEIIADFATAFKYTETKSQVSFPSVTVNLAGTDFTFGGWDVDLVPEGFELVVDSLKFIVNIVCTFVFIMAIRKRWEEIVKR